MCDQFWFWAFFARMVLFKVTYWPWRPHIFWIQIIKTDHLDNLDPLDHIDHHEHRLDNLDNLSHLNHLDHPDHPDHPDHLDLHDQPNQVSYNRDHQKIYQEDRYRICIAYFVLFQIMLIYVQLLLSITLLEQHSDAVSAICCADCANFLPVNAKTLLFYFALHFASRGLCSAYESNLVKSYHKFKHKSRSNVRIFTRHQLQHFNQTSASCRNLKFKIYQQQNTNQTPSSKCSLNFNFKILTKPCAQSLNKSLALWLNLSS